LFSTVGVITLFWLREHAGGKKSVMGIDRKAVTWKTKKEMEGLYYNTCYGRQATVGQATCVPKAEAQAPEFEPFVRKWG
jgi:hypothetical protein